MRAVSAEVSVLVCVEVTKFVLGTVVFADLIMVAEALTGTEVKVVTTVLEDVCCASVMFQIFSGMTG